MSANKRGEAAAPAAAGKERIMAQLSYFFQIHTHLHGEEF
jgi:hypothetical protein